MAGIRKFQIPAVKQFSPSSYSITSTKTGESHTKWNMQTEIVTLYTVDIFNIGSVLQNVLIFVGIKINVELSNYFS